MCNLTGALVRPFIIGLRIWPRDTSSQKRKKKIYRKKQEKVALLLANCCFILKTSKSIPSSV